MPATSPIRTILHADMDAFYASIEQRDDVTLRGRPVVVGGLGRRGVVSTASYEARRFGIRSAMPTAEARRRCPQAIFVTPRIEHYAAVAAQIRAVFADYTPEIEPLSLDEAFLDVTASRALFGDGVTIAERIRRDVRDATGGLTISVGVASNKFVAKVASDLRKPDGLVVVEPGREREFLAPLPIRRLWGAGGVAQARFEKLGMHTIGDVQRRSVDELCRLLGTHAGQHFWSLAMADDPRPVISEREAVSIGHERTFEVDLEDVARCHEALLELSERTARRLRHGGLRGRVVKLKLRFPPFETLTRQVTLPAATDDELVIHRAAVLLFDAARGDRSVRLLGVSLSALHEVGTQRAADPSSARQLELFKAAPDDRHVTAPDRAPRSAELLRALDSIRDRFGEDAIRHGALRADDGAITD